LQQELRNCGGEQTQPAFAKELGISFRAYRYYESGERMPPGDVLIKLAQISGRSVDWMLTGKERERWTFSLVSDQSSNSIGNRIKELRGERSMKSFADELNISFAAYQNYEYGKRIPPGEVLIKLAQISGRSVDWILTGKEYKQATSLGSPASLKDALIMEINELIQCEPEDFIKQLRQILQERKVNRHKLSDLRRGYK
jgi:transcriptional regulator with XRE-family HTH domain